MVYFLKTITKNESDLNTQKTILAFFGSDLIKMERCKPERISSKEEKLLRTEKLSGYS